MTKNTKSLLKAIFITLICFILILVCIVCGVVFIFPKSGANLLNSVNASNWASDLYYLDYSRSGDLDSLYRSLAIDITNERYVNIEKKYAVFEHCDKYSTYLSDRENAFINSDNNILIKAVAVFEDNALKIKYVNAILKNDRNSGFSRAMEYAVSNFSAYTTADIFNISNYLFSPIVSNSTDISAFVQEGVIGDKSVYEAMQKYFDTLVTAFNEKYNPNNNTVQEVAYLIALRNRLQMVGADLTAIYNKTSSGMTPTEIRNRVSDITNDIAVFIR